MPSLKYSILFLFHLVVTTVDAQKPSLQFDENILGLRKYKVNNENAEAEVFYSYLGQNDKALNRFNAGKKLRTTSTIIKIIGGLMMGYNAGQVLFNKSENYTFGAVGLGMVLVSIPINYSGTNKTDQALLDFHQLPYDTNVYKKPVLLENKEDQWHQSCLVVRFPVSASKVKYLNGIVNDSKTTTKAKSQAKKLLQTTLEENKRNFNLLTKGFEQYFDFKEVYFLPDSSFKSYLVGQKTPFLNLNYELDHNKLCHHETSYFFLFDQDKFQLTLVNKDLQRLRHPYPYKKKSWFAAFDIFFNPENLLNKQIQYFNEKLKMIKKLPKY